MDCEDESTFTPDYEDCTDDSSSSSGESVVTVIEVDSASRFVAASGNVLSVSVPACGRSVAATSGANVLSVSVPVGAASVSSVLSGPAGSDCPPALSDPVSPEFPRLSRLASLQALEPYSTPEPSQLTFPGLEDWVPEGEVSAFSLGADESLDSKRGFAPKVVMLPFASDVDQSRGVSHCLVAGSVAAVLHQEAGVGDDVSVVVESVSSADQAVSVPVVSSSIVPRVASSVSLATPVPALRKGTCPLCRKTVANVRKHLYMKHLPWYINPLTACWVCRRQEGSSCYVRAGHATDGCSHPSAAQWETLEMTH